jgi:hypothetical protein
VDRGVGKGRQPVTADPQDGLQQSMLQRASDLAAYMLQRGIRVEVASGTSANGHPCVVLIAIGREAERVHQIGLALIERVGREIVDDEERASQN